MVARMAERRYGALGRMALVAAVHVAGAPGIFDGRDVTIVTADFGVRR